MKNLPSASLASYQTGARAVCAKSLGSLAVGATVLAALPAETHAQILVTTGPATALAYVGGDNYVWLSPQTGTMSTTNFSGSLAYLYVAHPGRTYFRQHTPLTYDFAVVGNHDAVKFTAGQPIQGSDFYFTGWLSASDHATVWSDNSGYVGFRSTQTDGVHYGWIDITINNADASSVTVNAMGFDTVAGQTITAGEGLSSTVPEPASSALLLAAGAAGLAVYRQRKKIARAA